ncbi:ABC transporter permease [Pseudalkalibacillus hwajinpoensis]|uniref:ABC transporter permease n=1 Tax=Guptibacillus hwajinpoensis TaxID=208199 RepID=UPI001CD445E5|nr:ABC transporter permease subunit [Pseudalkalibacillus hwajinpoensis]MCA0989687.1 ABC transporter permease [Pseudalkalibacillus hwajinpoensis]
MLAIGLREFQNLFKSIRSIIIILFIFSVTLGIAKLINNYKEVLSEVGGLEGDIYMGGLLLLIIGAGPLFVTSLSHNAINQEVHSRTIRFLATKVSREKIVLGKFLGIAMYWMVCILVASLLILPFTKGFYFHQFMEALIFILYFVGLAIFLSTLITKPGMTMFLGSVLAILLPIIGLWSLWSENLIIDLVSYLTPYYYYSVGEHIYTYVVLIFPILFVLGSLLLIRKKDF